MIRTISVTTIVAIVMAIIPACNDNVDIIEIPAIKDVNFSEIEANSNDGINKFSVQFINSAANFESTFKNESSNSNGNVIVSPLSAAIAITMAANTFDAETELSIAKMLNEENINNSNSVVKKLMGFLPSSTKDLNLKLANSVAYNEKCTPKAEWVNFMARNLYSSVYPLNFDDVKSVDIINQWCSSNTNGMIKKFISQINDSTHVMLLNAMYLSGKWDSPFDESLSQADIFHSRDFGETKVAMMNTKAYYRYYECPEYQKIFIPFADDSTQFEIILPSADTSATEFAKTLTYGDIYYKIDHMERSSVKLSIPRFSAETFGNITQILQSMGLRKHINLSNLGIDVDAEIDVVQKSMIEINERGAEVASTTIASDLDLAPMLPQSKEYSMTVNRPFLFFFINTTTRTILSSGIVNNL